VGPSSADKVKRLARLHLEVVQAINDKTGETQIDLDSFMFDVMSAVGLLSLPNLKQVIGSRKAKALWDELQ
jgi:hypothetical protein